MDWNERGYNEGRGFGWKNSEREKFPQSDYDRASYERGREYGEYRRQISDELDREMYGDDR